MRKKSEQRRQSLLQAATEVFREMGFERASMDEICAREGSSKATLYNYFHSKEELFFEVMLNSAQKEFNATSRLLDANAEDISEALRNFGFHALKTLYSPPALAARRVIIFESGRSDLGRQFYEAGPKHGREVVSNFMASAIRAGKLRHADLNVIDAHFRALLDSELIEKFIFNLSGSFSDEELNGAANRAVDAFMLIYGIPKNK